MELLLRMFGIKHKLRVNDSIKPQDGHQEQSASLIARWELEDELKAIELILEETRRENVNEKTKYIQKEYLSQKPHKKKNI